MIALLGMAAVLVAIAATSAAQTDPPASGPWTVQDITFWDEDLTMTGNLTVNSSGSLKLDNMTLTIAGPSDGELHIFVEAGSFLELVNVYVRSSDPEVHYWFECRGKAVIEGSDVRDVASNMWVWNGSKTGMWNEWDDILGGVQIYDGTSVLRNSKFHDNQRINVYVRECAPEITNCEFYNAEYVNGYNFTQRRWVYPGYVNWSIYTLDATGLYLEAADPNITDCIFRNNGLRNTALPFFNDTNNYTYVMTLGRGILAHDSSPNITDCEFRVNGDQPPDRRVGNRRQVFIERYTYDITPQGGLACVGTSHPAVYGSLFFTNDLYGIYGAEGGYPSLVESCRIDGNQYIRGTSVLSPSGGIYIEGGSGTMVVANSSAASNLVYANIYVEEVSLHLINFTNRANVVNNAYNIYVGGGRHYFEDCFLDGRPELAANIYVRYSQSAPKLRIESCILQGATYGLFDSNSQNTNVVFTNSTITGVNQATFYLYSTTVDCINCTISPLRVDSSSSRSSIVRIMYYLEIDVTWQNGKVVPGAFVQVFNSTKDFVYGDIADENGTVGPIVVPSKIILASLGREEEVSNSPLYLSAYSAGLQSDEDQHVFTTNMAVRIIIIDDVPPTIYVFTPTSGHRQNTTSLEVRGMCTDVGAGVNSTYISLDGVDWTWIAGDQQTWEIVLELAEGHYTIHIKCVDEAEKASTKKVEEVNIDLTPPLLEVVDPVKAVWYTNAENYTLRGRVNGQAILIINRQPVDVAPDGTWESPQEIHSGTNEFVITATDNVGNSYVIFKSIIRDSSEPKLILTSPEEGMWTNNSQIEVKGITELGATIFVNGNPLPTFDGRFATNMFLTEGVNMVIVEAVDKANNLKRVERRVYLDSIPPALQVESPRRDALVSDRFLPIMGTIDDPSVTHVIVNGLLVPVVDQTFHKDFRLDEGENPIVIEVWDGASNYVTRIYMIVLDTTPPDLKLLEPEPGLETMDPTVRIRGTLDADVNMFIWGEPLHDDFDIINLVHIENTFRFDQYPLVRGVNTIHLEAEDDVGNVVRMTFQVTYDLEPPSLMVSPMVEKTTRQVVTVSGILLDGAEIRISGVPGVLGPNGEFTESVYLQSGKNAIKIVAFDAAGNRVEETVNVTRTAVEVPEEGILGAGIAFSLVLVLIMLVIGLAIILPGIKGGTIEPEALVGEPIIVDEHGEPIDAGGAPTMTPPRQEPEEPRGPPSPPPDHRRPPSPPPGYQAPQQEQGSGLPPKPPWQD